MKKKLLTVILAVAVLCAGALLAACDQTDFLGATANDVLSVAQMEKMLENKQFSMTLRYYGSDGKDSSEYTIAYIVSDKGYYYRSSEDEQGVLFVSRGNDRYDYYYLDETARTKTLYLDNTYARHDFTQYLLSFGTSYASDYFERKGTDKVAGRKCEVYEFDYAKAYKKAASVAGAMLGEDLSDYKFKYTYYLDSALGICLKQTYEASDGKESGAYGFEVTAFDDGPQSIDAYINYADRDYYDPDYDDFWNDYEDYYPPYYGR